MTFERDIDRVLDRAQGPAMRRMHALVSEVLDCLQRASLEAERIGHKSLALHLLKAAADEDTACALHLAALETAQKRPTRPNRRVVRDVRKA